MVNTFQDQTVDAAQNIINTHTMYAVNTGNGEMKEVALYNNYDASRRPVLIYDTVENGSLLVEAQVQEIDKGPEMGRVVQKTLGIISAQDYLNSVPNYQLIAPLGE